MAQFEEAIQNTLLWEGGYSNNPLDRGGETYRGISRNNWPTWNGWYVVDADKVLPNFPKCLDTDIVLQQDVVAFYRQNFWFYDEIADQSIANKIFDLAVNVGKVHAHKIAQTAVGIDSDGFFGPQTILAINSTSNGSQLLQAIKDTAVEYYKTIVQSHPTDATFLKGWIKRAES